MRLLNESKVTLRARVWIESRLRLSVLLPGCVTLRARVWIERISGCSGCCPVFWSLSVRECGLKAVTPSIIVYPVKVTLRARVWIESKYQYDLNVGNACHSPYESMNQNTSPLKLRFCGIETLFSRRNSVLPELTLHTCMIKSPYRNGLFVVQQNV